MILHRISRVTKRSLFYFKNGYAFASLPLVLMGYASSIYYLAVDHITPLKTWFPTFSRFIGVGLVTLPIFCILLGYIYMKRSFLYPTDQQVSAEATPFAYRLHPGRETLLQSYVVLGVKLTNRLADRFDLFESKQEKEAWEEYIRLLDFLSKGGDIRHYRFREVTN